MRRFGLVLLAVLAVTGAPAATLDEIVAKSRRVLDGINDFTCLMVFTVRSADMRVPDSRVRLYFKKPDKFRPEAVDGDFAVLPETYHFAIGSVLERMLKECRGQVLREEVVANRRQWVLKLVPQDTDTPVQYHLVWVDQQQGTVTRITTYPDRERPVTIKLSYRAQGRGWLPDRASIDAWQKRRSEGGTTTEAITVALRFEKYRVNTGLSDDLFAAKPKG